MPKSDFYYSFLSLSDFFHPLQLLWFWCLVQMAEE